MQQLTQTLQCLDCAQRFVVSEELFQHQRTTGHTDCQLVTIYTFRFPKVGLAPTPGRA